MKSKEEITKDYEKIINYVIKDMHAQYKRDEIFDLGMIGFVKGINTFDETKNVNFTTYLYSCIKNEMMHYFEKQNRQKRIAEVVSYNTMVSEKTELIDLLGYDVDYDQDVYINDMMLEVLRRLEYLTDKQQFIFNHLYGLNGYREMTAKEIEEKYGISRQSVNQIKKRIINKLRFVLMKYQNEEREYSRKK